MIRDWKTGACELVPGRTAPNYVAVERDYEELIEACAALLAPGGVIVFSTNARRFRMDEAALPEGLVVRDVSKRTVPEDFRNRRIHQCWLISFGESTRTRPGTDAPLP